MKPERQIRATYADILNHADPATVHIIGDLDMLYTGTTIPAAPAFNSLVTPQTTPRSVQDAGTESTISGYAVGGPPRPSRNWLRQGFAFASAAVAFTVVAAILVLLFRGSDDEGRLGAGPTSVPAVTAAANEILYLGPDGQSLLSTLPIDLGTRVILLSDGPLRSPVWSPDGSRVAFSGVVGDQSGVFVISVEGSGLQLIAEATPLIIDLDINWSPDGTRLAFRRVTASDLDSGNVPPGSGLATRIGTPERSEDQHIYVVDADGSGLRRLNDGGQVGAPTWAPNGQQLAFTQSASSSGGTTHNLVAVNLGSGETRQITDGTNVQPNPQWSPDGQQILFAAGPDNVRELVTVFVNGETPNSGFRALIDASENVTGGKWSPDGQMIAFYSTREDQPGIWVINADGSNPRRVVAIAGGARFDWSPDSGQIAYVSDPGRNLPYRLFSTSIDGGDARLIADDLHYTAQPDWSPIIGQGETATPEPTATTNMPALPTPTRSAQQPIGPLTPNTLDTLAPLQPGQELHFVFDIRTDYRSDESSFLTWNVKGSQRILPDGTFQQHLIVRDEADTVLIEYVDDGEHVWLKQRDWIETVRVPMPYELGVALLEPRLAASKLNGDAADLLEERTEGDVHIARYSEDSSGRIDEQLGVEIASIYYEVHSTGDPVRVIRTRHVVVATDGTEYTLFDITFESVVIIPAQDGPGNYVVPEGPTDDTLRYTPPTELPNGFTLERHWRDAPAREHLSITGTDGQQITGIISPSRGGLDTRQMQVQAERIGTTAASGNLAGGEIAWLYDETNTWPALAVWDNGHYRIELNVSNVTSPDDWNEASLTSLIYALAGESQQD